MYTVMTTFHHHWLNTKCSVYINLNICSVYRYGRTPAVLRQTAEPRADPSYFLCLDKPSKICVSRRVIIRVVRKAKVFLNVDNSQTTVYKLNGPRVIYVALIRSNWIGPLFSLIGTPHLS